MLFDKQTYTARRTRLQPSIGSGLILMLGNNDSPMNYPANTYKFRQDSSFLYFTGLHREGLALLIDADNGEEWLFGNDISLDDIVWFGAVDSVAEMASQSGISHSAPMSALAECIKQQTAKGRKLHFLPPYRHDTMIQLMDLTGIHPSRLRDSASLQLIKAVIEQRAVKSQAEIAEIDKACNIG